MGNIYIWIAAALLFGIVSSIMYVSLAQPKPTLKRYATATTAYSIIGLCIAAALYIIFN